MHDQQRITHNLKKLTVAQLKTRLSYNFFTDQNINNLDELNYRIELYESDLDIVQSRLEACQIQFDMLPSFYERVALDRAKKEYNLMLSSLRDLTEYAVIKKMLGDVGFKSVSLD